MGEAVARQEVLISGAEALAESALRAGCRAYFSYPSPMSREMDHHLAAGLSARGGVHLRAQSPEEAVSMLIGASAAGARGLTVCSGGGLSRMQEGLSHLAGLELPAVIAVLSRGGPGLGNWHPSQGDYFPATRAGHGDGHPMVLAPGSVREMADFTQQAFDLADKYRNPVIILADTLLSRLREPLEPFPPAEPAEPADRPAPDWALDGARSRPARSLVSFLPDPRELQARNHKLVRKYDAIAREETAWQTTDCQDALLAVVAFGGAARIAAEAVQLVRAMGMRVGLFRPRTVCPFPQKPLQELAHQVRCFLVVELNTGQMLQDVELALAGQAPVHFHGRPGGATPTPAELAHQISHYYHRAGLHNGPDSGHQ